MNSLRFLALSLTLVVAPWSTADELNGQDFPTDDPIIRAIWAQGMEAGSQVESLAQALMDSIGPRLSGSPGQRASWEWALSMYENWDVPARTEQYGTWRGWDRGYTHIDLVEPRRRTLNGTMLAWSPGTDGPVEGEVVVLPTLRSQAEFDAWIPTVSGKFVALWYAEPTCRAPESWQALATEESQRRLQALQQSVQAEWSSTTQGAGGVGRLAAAVEAAGAVGIIISRWSNGWGANKIFESYTGRIPSLHLSCEDYGLVHRLASNEQGPVLRVDAQAEFLGEVPVSNVVGELRGTELPNEYVVLNAHFDSWDGASGATDNGTGTIMMMEAMRILKTVLPEPRRTILVAHWGGEEQGTNGSLAFAEDHSEVIDGLQAAFNQDNGTWRVDAFKMQDFPEAAENWDRWLSVIPRDITQHTELDLMVVPESGSSDEASFICRGAQGFRLMSHYPDYRQYTWHTDLDTYDKIVFDDLRNNATLVAMLAYMASEDPRRTSNARPPLPAGQQRRGCRTPQRNSGN
ncbi:MAG TPA: M20/M25/M40 family metallo-hydrolase [Gemmatimonadetes bacterium]|nr:M20/M25/M40 family metallo-hydrolase [Gemmatimonadota bacterium]